MPNRIKYLRRVNGTLEQIDLGEASPDSVSWESFDYTVEGQTFPNCYAEPQNENETPAWKLVAFGVSCLIWFFLGSFVYYVFSEMQP